MKIVELNESLEERFWKYVFHDPLDHYFFIYDFKQNREKSRFYIAVNVREEILGLGLNYDNHVVQLRGTEEAIRSMIKELNFQKTILQFPFEHEQAVQSSYPLFGSKLQVNLMSIAKGHENIKLWTTPEKLKVEDSKEISNLLSQTELAGWNSSVEEIASRFEDSQWFGVKENGKLVSIGAARLNFYGSLIGPIATLAAYRNRGYATTVVSAFVAEAQKIPSIPIIFVRSDNEQAIRIYSSVGFEPYKSYIYLYV